MDTDRASPDSHPYVDPCIQVGANNSSPPSTHGRVWHSKHFSPFFFQTKLWGKLVLVPSLKPELPPIAIALSLMHLRA